MYYVLEIVPLRCCCTARSFISSILSYIQLETRDCVEDPYKYIVLLWPANTRLTCKSFGKIARICQPASSLTLFLATNHGCPLI